MHPAFERLSIENLNGGAVVDLFAEEWSRVIADIADANKPAEKTRTILIEIEVKPDEARRTAEVTVRAKSKLPPAPGAKGIAYFSREQGGVSTYVNDPGQKNLFEEGVIEMIKEKKNG